MSYELDKIGFIINHFGWLFCDEKHSQYILNASTYNSSYFQILNVYVK